MIGLMGGRLLVSGPGAWTPLNPALVLLLVRWSVDKSNEQYCDCSMPACFYPRSIRKFASLGDLAVQRSRACIL